MEKLKDDDKKLLNILQEEDMCVPRITKLAHKLGLPTSTVQAKIERLQRIGAIEGFSAIVNPVQVGKPLTAFWFGNVSKGPGKDLETVPKKLAKIPQVQEVYFVSGEWDFIIKGRVKDQDEYYEVAKKLVETYEEQSGLGMMAPKCFKDTHKIIVD